MNQEVEVKAKVVHSKELRDKLTLFGVALSSPLTQDDETFIHTSIGSYAELKKGDVVLRIRKQNGVATFTLKKSLANELDCLEHETVIENPDELREALLCMEYVSAVVINKVRQKGVYKEYEICLDEVEGLGSFIEVEKKTNGIDSEVVQEELFVFLESLGVSRDDRVHQGYDTLIFQKNS